MKLTASDELTELFVGEEGVTFDTAEREKAPLAAKKQAEHAAVEYVGAMHAHQLSDMGKFLPIGVQGF